MEEENYKKQAEEWQYQSMPMKSPEIVEIGEDSKSFTSSREGGFKDVYVAVGRDDLDVLKWALDHSVSPQARIFLVHVFPPQTYISTPVGRLSRSQLSKEQLKVYINEENNRRRNLLQKYIRLCTDAKVTVDTMLLESNTTTKAILDLIPVLNITNLVIGTKRPPCPRRSWKKLGTGEFIQKNAPEFCEVTIVFDGKKVLDGEQIGELVHSSPASSHRKPETTRNSERNFFECACFSVYRSNNISHRSPHHLPDAEREGKAISRGSKTRVPLLMTCMKTISRRNFKSDLESLLNSPVGSSLDSNASRKDHPRSSSSTSSDCCSRSLSEEEEDDGCLDDWEAVADALGINDNQQNPISEPPVKPEARIGSADTELPKRSSGVDLLKTESGGVVPISQMNSRAWRPDDALRPQSLPNLSKQCTFPMNSERHCHRAIPWAWKSTISQPSSCPICCEDLDLTDSSFLPSMFLFPLWLELNHGQHKHGIPLPMLALRWRSIP